MGRLGLRHRLVDRIVSGVRVSVSFQIFALRMWLHFAGVTSGRFSLEGNIRGGYLQALPPGIVCLIGSATCCSTPPSPWISIQLLMGGCRARTDEEDNFTLTGRSPIERDSAVTATLLR